MTQGLEARLRETLSGKANAITTSNLRDWSPERPPPAVLAPSETPASRRPLVLAMAVLVIMTGLTAIVISRDAQRAADAPIAAGPSPFGSVGPVPRAWPLNGDEPLPAPTPDDPRTPDAIARSYLTEVVELPADWPLQDLAHQAGAAVADYILQDVPSQIRLARADNDSWYVTSATTDLARPELVGPTASGLDVSVAPGPRTYANGMNVRVAAIATDGRELARTVVRATPPKGGNTAVAAEIASLHWTGVELAAAVRADVLDDHDNDQGTPEAIIGHWTVGVAAPRASGLPAGYDVDSAEPVHLGVSSDVDAVVADYARARFPDYPAPGIEIERSRTRGRRATARWEVRDAEIGGHFFLRQRDGRWDVIAATTDGIDLTNVRVEPGRVHGRATTTNINSMFADVLLLDGTPVPGSPRPDGHPDADYRFATAGGPANRAVEVDVPVSAPAALRIGLVGGTILAVTEVRVS